MAGFHLGSILDILEKSRLNRAGKKILSTSIAYIRTKIVQKLKSI